MLFFLQFNADGRNDLSNVNLCHLAPKIKERKAYFSSQSVKISVHSWLALRQGGMPEGHCRGQTVHGRTYKRQLAVASISLLFHPGYQHFGWYHIHMGWVFPLSTLRTMLRRNTNPRFSQFQKAQPMSAL